MTKIKNIYNFLDSKKTFKTLIILYAIISVVIFLFNLDAFSGDQYTYMYYAKGMHAGKYTYWYMLKDYVPDTFRNPGYPIFIYLFSFISDSMKLIKLTNFIAFATAIYLVFRIIDLYTKQPSYTIKNIFLFLMIFNSHLLIYIDFIFPEVIMFFLITLLVYLNIRLSKQKISTYIILGLLYGVIFQIRPVILFFPFIKFGIELFLQKKNFSVIKNLTLVIVFIATMLPYGYWNYKNNGVFNITSLEGGGGVMHLSYWGFKMPNHLETRYWRNIVEEDLIIFTPKEDVPRNIEAFNKEWDFIDSTCAQYLTDADRKNIPLMKQHPELFVTYNGRYTYEREKLLKKLAVQHFLDDPIFTLKVKVYTAFRLWVTGIKRKTFESNNPVSLFIGIAPAVITGITLLLALIFIPLAIFRRKFNYIFLLPILLLVGYYGFIHLPFAIQARYTVPVRPLLMMITAICIFELYFRKEVPND